MDEIILPPGAPLYPRRPVVKRPKAPKRPKANPYLRAAVGRRNRLARAINPSLLSPWGYGKPGNTMRNPGAVQKRTVSGTGSAGAPGAAGAFPAGTPVTGNPLPGMNPYYGLPDWAQNQLRQIDADQRHHEEYASGTVAPWLSQALANLTGIDPAHPGLNTVNQSRYLDTVRGAVGGAYGAAASATPMNPGATTPGGIVASPTAYLSNAAREGAVGRSSGAIQSAETQAMLNTMQPNTQSQGYVYALADYMKGLPALYSQKRAEARSNIDQFIAQSQADAARQALDLAKFNEDARHHRVGEAISAQNAGTNAAIGLGRLGLSASDQAHDNQTPTGPVPYGYVQLPDGSYRRDPSVPNATNPSTTTSKPKGTYTPNELKKQGFIVVPKGAGPAWTKNAVKATDGRFYIKQGSGGKAGGSTPKADTENIRETLDKFYYDKIDGKLEPEVGARRVANFILARKMRFVKKNGQADAAAVARLLKEVIGGPTIPALVGQLIASHIGPNGRWT